GRWRPRAGRVRRGRRPPARGRRAPAVRRRPRSQPRVAAGARRAARHRPRARRGDRARGARARLLPAGGPRARARHRAAPAGAAGRLDRDRAGSLFAVIALEERWLRLQQYLDHGLWQAAGGGVPARIGRWLLQIAVIVSQGVARNQTMLRASALTYFTMLSLIPLLALALGLVEAFGSGDALVLLVARQIGAVSPDAGEQILELVRRVDFRSLGAVGAATLFVTTVLAL